MAGRGGAWEGEENKIRTARADDKACLVDTVSLRVFLVWEIAVVTHQEKGLGG